MGAAAIVNAIALLASLIWLGRLVLPLSQAVRLRNALLLRRGKPSDFDWTPREVPGDFRVERRSAPEAIQQAVAAGVERAESDWTRMRSLVAMLVRHWKYERPIQADLLTTYRSIVAGEGYCSDYVRVYLASAHAAGLFCRQWAFSFDGFGGHGHTFVEVYDRQRSRWVFLDVHNNVYAVAGNDEPLDALALWKALLEESPLEFRRAGPGRLGFVHFDKLVAYYKRGRDEWYLWWGNDVITRDRTGIASPITRISGRWAHRLASALGNLPPLVVRVTERNEAAVASMETLRRRARLALTLSALLAVALGLQWYFGLARVPRA